MDALHAIIFVLVDAYTLGQTPQHECGNMHNR